MLENEAIGTFTQEDTRRLKGLAVILMIVHHLFIIAGRINADLFPVPQIHLFGSSFMALSAAFGKICVSLFFILSGFGQYRKYEQNLTGGGIKQTNL